MHERFEQFRIKTRPADEPLTVDAAKKYLRVDGSDDDDEIGGFISGARRAAENGTLRLLQECECSYEADVCEISRPAAHVVILPRGPLKRDDQDAIQGLTVKLDGLTLDAACYEVEESDTTLPKIVLKKSGKRVLVDYTAGHAAAAVPATLIAAMKFTLDDWWNNREVDGVVTDDMRQVPPPAKNLFDLERLY